MWSKKEKGVVEIKLASYCLILLLLIGCEPKENTNPTSPVHIVDRDQLVERFQLIHDFNSVEEFDTTKLKSLENDPDRKDYKKVLRTFISEYFQKEMESFQTISKSENQRHILVITKDGWLYSVSLKQRADHNDIWTVDMYGDLSLAGLQQS